MAAYLIEMFGVSLLLTWLVELPVAVLFGFYTQKKIVLVILVNLLTNPPAVLFCWLGSLYLPDVSSVVIQIAAEAAVIVTEAYIYLSFAADSDWRIPHPVILAVAANVCSWLIGRRFLI